MAAPLRQILGVFVFFIFMVRFFCVSEHELTGS